MLTQWINGITQFLTFGSWIPLLTWWFLILVLFGLAVLPLTSILFQQQPTKGYALAKPFGIAIVGYILFSGSTFLHVPITPYSIGIVTAVVAAICWGVWFRYKNDYRLPSVATILIVDTALFLAFLSWSYIRGHEPSLASLEKYMDLGFIASIVRHGAVPAQDMWFGPTASHQLFPINYYYFGHFITALLSVATKIPPAITYNFMLATVFSFLLIGGFTVAWSLYTLLFPHHKKRFGVIAGILATYIINFGANLQTIYIFAKNYPDQNPIPFWKILAPFGTNPYWYPRATRFIPFTIHEFPSYSHVVADLHGHLINTSHVLILIALFLSIIANKKNKVAAIATYFFIGLFLAISYMTNATDLLVYGAFAFVVLTIQFKHLIPVFLRFLGIMGTAIIALIPFSKYFSSFVSGIGVNCAPEFLVKMHGIGPIIAEAGKCQTSPIWMLAILWGFFWLITITFIYLFFFRNKLEAKEEPRYFVFFMLMVAVLLTFFAEFFYFKDIYPAHFRANTMFKLGYQAYILFSLASGSVLVAFALYIKRFFSLFALLWGVVLTIAFFFVAIYPAFSIPSYYGSIGKFVSLDGAKWIQTRYPDHANLISYIQKNIPSTAKPFTILEAHGDSYTDYDLVSAYTGIPTIIGWPVHEWLWRGSYDIVAPRAQDVQKIYSVTPQTRDEVKKLLKKYLVHYIVISPSFEQKKYPSISLTEWYILGKPVFAQNGTYLFQINK